MTQGYLTDPATRQNTSDSEFTPFPVADEGFETGFELLSASTLITGGWLGSRTLPNQPQMAIWWPNEHPPGQYRTPSARLGAPQSAATGWTCRRVTSRGGAAPKLSKKGRARRRLGFPRAVTLFGLFIPGPAL